MFKTERKSRFTDVNNNRLTVEYGTEEREEVLSNGAKLRYTRKVRLTLPEGERVILYQTLSPSGVRYQSTDKQYLFIEHGPWCRLTKEGNIIYQGVFSGNIVIK